MIRSVRKVLNATLRTQTLDEDCLHTVLCEAEAIINGRPITKKSSDPNDLEALTPNHLLLLKTAPSLPLGIFQKEDIYMLVDDGNKCSIYRICSGNDGQRSIYLNCKSDRSGPLQPATSFQEILCFWWMILHPVIHG